MERQRIPLYKIRRFGEKIGDTFAFVSENFKPLMKYLTYSMLPMSLLMGLATNGYVNGIVGAMPNFASAAGGGSAAAGDFGLTGMLLSSAGMLLVTLLAYPLMEAVVYGLMRVYGERENRLKNLAWSELKPMFMHLLKRAFVLMAFSLGIIVLVFGLTFLSGFLHGLGSAFGITVLLLFYAVLMVLMFPLLLMFPIYLFEDDATLLGALKKSMVWGFRTWGGIFAVFIVLVLLMYIVMSIVSLPWVIALAAKMVFGLEGGGANFVTSPAFSFITYLLSVLNAFVSFLCYAVPQIGLAYQYGHAAEKFDHVTVDTDIEQFETL